MQPSYQDIPGVTEDEIRVIEDFIKQGVSFLYGTIPSTESFINQDGKISGFTILLCDWLTELFGIPFDPKLYNWGDLLVGLENGEIDFTGELTAIRDRHGTYIMTDAIALRLIKYFRIAGSAPLCFIAQSRPVRLAFLRDTTTINNVMQWLNNSYEIFCVSRYEEAYHMLKDGTIDAFVEEHTAEEAFDIYGDIEAETFFPLSYTPVSLATQKDENAAVISIVQKALQNGGMQYLTELYNIGEKEYKENKFRMSLTNEELEYIKSNPIIKFVSEYDNYSVSFYNARKKEFQGIFYDVREEIKMFTGLRFEQVNDRNQDWAELLNMLENGEAEMSSELLRTPERIRRFLWAENSVLSDRYALLSKSDFPNLNINEIANVRVGVVGFTGQAETFFKWFPDHPHTVIYHSFEQAFTALSHREVDAVMGGLNQLLVLTHFRELPQYKANIVFDFPYKSTFGFNVNETILCSIIDKSLRLIDTEGLAGHWTRRTYDYRWKLAAARLPWLIGVVALIFVLIWFGIVMSFRKRKNALIIMEAELKEKELTADNAVLDKVSKMKNELLENLTHELRTPLTVMSTFAQFALKAVLQNDISEQTADDLKLIISEASRLADMSSGVLLSFCDNEDSAAMVPFNMQKIIEHAGQLAGPMLRKNRNKLFIDIGGDIPPVFGRVYECTQVFGNLLSNAATHTKHGKITISASVATESEKPMLVVTVSDTGPGISADILPNVFMRRHTGTEGGAGLGLAICKDIIKAHGGEITIENGEKYGVVVRFTLPLAESGGIE